jgi:hypothetical protein
MRRDTTLEAEYFLDHIRLPIDTTAGPLGALLLRKKVRELRLREAPVDADKARQLMFELGAGFFVVLGEETGVKTLARIRQTMLDMGLDV